MTPWTSALHTGHIQTNTRQTTVSRDSLKFLNRNFSHYIYRLCAFYTYATRQLQSYFTQKIPPNKSTLHVSLSFSHRIFCRGPIERNNFIRNLYGKAAPRLAPHHLSAAAELNNDILRHKIFFSHFFLYLNSKFWFATFICIEHCVAVEWQMDTDFPLDSAGVNVCLGHSKSINLSSFCANANAFPTLGVDHSNCTNECAPQWWH